jgi:hypothetical protein
VRVVFPYVDAHPRALAGLDEFAPNAERFFLGRTSDAYWRLLSDLWCAGEGFAIIEQDIELRAGVLESFEQCPEPWCLFAYAGAGWSTGGNPLFRQSLGCTRFATALLVAEPDLLSVVGSVSQGLPAKDWRRLDVTIAPALTNRCYAAHVHEPFVLHHHDYPNEGCSCQWKPREMQ